jgi:hypothetical protein
MTAAQLFGHFSKQVTAALQQHTAESRASSLSPSGSRKVRTTRPSPWPTPRNSSSLIRCPLAS